MIFFFIILPIAIFLLIYFYKKNSNKEERLTDYELSKSEKIGKQGEDLIIQECINAISDQRILRNLYVPTENGNLTELDVVLINQYGIFVIESKNYHSWIFGKAGQRIWTLKYPGGKTEHLFNPIWQNRYHVKCLQELLGLPLCFFYSLIVFGDKTEIKTEIGTLQQREFVFNLDDLKEYINNLQLEKPVFNAAFINFLADSLHVQYGEVSQEVKNQHIEKLNQKYNNSYEGK